MVVYCHMCSIMNYCPIGKPEVSTVMSSVATRTEKEVMTMVMVSELCPLRKIVGDFVKARQDLFAKAEKMRGISHE